MLGRRYTVVGRDNPERSERVLGISHDVAEAHAKALKRLENGFCDVTVRDEDTRTQWIPVPWRIYDDPEA